MINFENINVSVLKDDFLNKQKAIPIIQGWLQLFKEI